MTNTRSNVRKGWRSVWKEYPYEADVVGITDVVADFGADNTGATDATTAFNNAIATGNDLFVPPGTYLVNNLVLSAYQSIFGAGRQSILKKNLNGPIVTLGRESDISDLKLDGAGATYTGVGVAIPATAEYEGEQRLTNLWIIDTASYCVQYTQQFAGFGSSIIQCILSPRNYTTTACVKWSGLEPNSNEHGDRTIIGCICNGPIVDASSSNVGYVTNCISGDSGSLGPIICDQYTGKLFVTGCRLVGPQTIQGYDQSWQGIVFSSTVTISNSSTISISNMTTGGTLTISGSANHLTGCHFEGNISISGDYNIISGSSVNSGYGLTLASGAEYNRIADTYISGTFTDSSGNSTNHYDIGPVAYTPSWTASSSNPVLGSSTLIGRYVRRGQQVTASFKLTITTGGSYSAGTGDYYFSLPFAAATNLEQTGTVQVFDSGTTNLIGVCRTLTDGTARCYIQTHSNGSVANPTNPITWATGDTIYATITYTVN